MINFAKRPGFCNICNVEGGTHNGVCFSCIEEGRADDQGNQVTFTIFDYNWPGVDDDNFATNSKGECVEARVVEVFSTSREAALLAFYDGEGELDEYSLDTPPAHAIVVAWEGDGR